MTDTITTTLASLEADLLVAQEQYRVAENAERMARREATSALNLLNDIQSRIDAKVAELRKAAPAGDWKDDRARRDGVRSAT